MVTNDKAFREEEAKIKLTLNDAAQGLAELVLRAYKQEQNKKGDAKNDK